MIKSVFITSSGTGIGKTHVAAALVRHVLGRGGTVRALKPVISGFTWDELNESDTGLLLDALGEEKTETAVSSMSPWRFEAPLSPDMAAARENRSIDFEELLGFCRETPADGPADLTLIEGVGGAMVPLDDRHSVLDWMAALEIPAVVVVGSYLGTISHTLTTIEAVRGGGVEIAAVVISESEDSPVPIAETRATLERFLGSLPVVALARNAGHGSAAIAVVANVLGLGKGDLDSPVRR